MRTAILLTFTALCAFAQPKEAPATGTFEGIAVDSTGAPAMGAEIRLYPNNAPPGNGPAVGSATVLESGEFRMKVAPGTYTVDVGGRYRFDLSRWGRLNSRSVQIRAGQTAERRIPAFLPAVITGTIRGGHGDPIPDLDVVVLRYISDNQRRLLQQVSRIVRTDDRGQYRLFDVPPGRSYIQAASYQVTPLNMDTSGVFPTTYFGNTTDPRRATTVDIRSGDDLRNMDILVEPVAPLHIRGRALTAAGQPLAATLLQLTPADGRVSYNNTTRADGSFQFTRLIPGDYVILTSDDRSGMPVSLRANVDGIEFRQSSGATITGKLIVDGAESLPQGFQMNFQLNVANVTSRPRWADAKGFGVSRAGVIEGRNIDPGTYFLSLASNRPVYIQSVNGQSADPAQPVLLNLRDTGPNSLNVALSTHTATLSGTTPKDALIVLWPVAASDTTWNPFALRTTRPKPDGKFQIEGVAPGRYRVAAFDPTAAEIDGLVFEPAFLRQFAATTVEFGEDAQATAELTLVSRQAVAAARAELP